MVGNGRHEGGRILEPSVERAREGAAEESSRRTKRVRWHRRVDGVDGVVDVFGCAERKRHDSSLQATVFLIVVLKSYRLVSWYNKLLVK